MAVGVRRPVAWNAAQPRRLSELVLLVAWLIRQVEPVVLGFVVLRCRESHIWDRILTFVGEAHGNAGIALSRSFYIKTDQEAFVSGKQSTVLFWVARF
jgi:hypothetical protein